MTVRDFGVFGIGLNFANCVEALRAGSAAGSLFFGVLVVVPCVLLFRSGR